MRSKKITFILLLLILTGCKNKTYIVSFDTNGGKTMDSITLTTGSNLKNIEEPTKEGYLFVHWLKDGLEYNLENPITEDITLTASWIEAPNLNDYTITFINEGYEEKIIVKENSILPTPKVKTKENHTFLGWYQDDQKYDFNNKVTKDMILVAKYELNTVTVTYELDGGTGVVSKTIPKGSLLEIPNKPERTGYRFLKWILNNKEFSFDTKITKDITIKAVWEKIEYITITYDTDGGNTIEATTIEKYSKINELPIPKKEGYIFKEWQLDNNAFDIDLEIETSIVLKAIYEPENQGE